MLIKELFKMVQVLETKEVTLRDLINHFELQFVEDKQIHNLKDEEPILNNDRDRGLVLIPLAIAQNTESGLNRLKLSPNRFVVFIR